VKLPEPTAVGVEEISGIAAEAFRCASFGGGQDSMLLT